jgi:hypothetical protein
MAVIVHGLNNSPHEIFFYRYSNFHNDVGWHHLTIYNQMINVVNTYKSKMQSY